MKNLKKVGMALTAGAIAITMILGMTACGKEKAAEITNEHLSFKVASIGYASENPLGNDKVSFEKGKIKVKVPENTTCVIVNLGKFFQENEGVLGRDVSFTRSDRTGVGMVYDLVGNDAARDNRVWREYGVTEEGEGINKLGGLKYSHADFPKHAKTGLAIFRFNKDRAEINFFTARNAQHEPIYNGANYHFGHADATKEFTLTITGHNGKKHKMHLVVEVDTAAQE